MDIIFSILPIIMLVMIVTMPVIFLSAVGYVIFRAIKKGDARAHQLQLIATQMKWTFAHDVPIESIPYSNLFRLFTEYRRPRIQNLLSGVANGNQVIVFDYSYQTRYGRNRRKFQTVILLMSNKFNLPVFYLRPAGLIEQLGSSFSDGLSFPAHGSFSEKCVLGGTDEKSIRRFFTDPMLNYCTANPNLSVEAGGGQMFIYEDRHLVPPEQIGGSIQTAVQMSKLLERGMR